MPVWIGYRPGQVKFIRGNPKTFSKSHGIKRSFCSDYGPSITYVDDGLKDEIYVSIGFMSAPDRFRPQAHGYWELRLPFIKMDDGLARIDGYTP